MIQRIILVIFLLIMLSNEKTIKNNSISTEPEKDFLDIISLAAKEYLSKYPEFTSVIDLLNQFRKRNIKMNNEEFQQLWDRKKNKLVNDNIHEIKNLFNNFKFNETDEKRIIEEEKNKLNIIFNKIHDLIKSIFIKGFHINIYCIIFQNSYCLRPYIF